MPSHTLTRRATSGIIAIAVLGSAALATTTAMAVGPGDLPAAFVVDSGSHTITLQYNYEATETVVLPDGYTLDGNGHTIYAVGQNWIGPVVANDGAGDIGVKDLFITRTIRNGNWADDPDLGSQMVAGIAVKNGGLDVADVAIDGILAQTLNQNGYGIVVENSGMSDEAEVNIDGVLITNYTKGGIYIFGQHTEAWITDSVVTVGSPATASNAIMISSGATAEITDNYLQGGQWAGSEWSASGILLYGAGDVAIEGNQIEEAEIAVSIDPSSFNTGRYTGVTPKSDITIVDNEFVAPSTVLKDVEPSAISILVGKTGTVTHSGNTMTGYATASEIVDESSPSVLVKAAFEATPKPVISGSVKVGNKLSAKAGTWAPKPTLAYQWFRNGVAIPQATSTTYTLTGADYGKTILVKVTATKVGYSARTRVSASTSKVKAGTFSKPTPVISGSAKVGKILTVKTGTWAPGTVTFSYTWYRDGKSISGAKAATYTVVKADKGKKITVKVSAKATGYTSASKTSKATAKVS